MSSLKLCPGITTQLEKIKQQLNREEMENAANYYSRVWALIGCMNKGQEDREGDLGLYRRKAFSFPWVALIL